MALYHTHETERTFVDALSTKAPPIATAITFSIFDALPHPVIIRGENLELIFKNKAAQKESSSLYTSCYYADTAQQLLKEKADFLFQQKRIKKTHHFDLEINECYLHIHQTLEQTPDGTNILIETFSNITEQKTNDIALHLLSINTDNDSSDNYLDQLTRELSKVFNLDLVMIAMTSPDKNENTTLSCWERGQHIPNFSYTLGENPCGRIFETKETLFISSHAQALYPHEPLLKTFNTDSFYGIPLTNTDGKMIGVFSILHSQSIAKAPLLKKVLEKLIPKLTLEVSSKKYLQKLELQSEWLLQSINSFKGLIAVFKKDSTIRAFNEAFMKIIKTKYDINLEKGLNILEALNKTNLLSPNELKIKQDFFAKVFQGENPTYLISLDQPEQKKHFSISFHPIYNFEKTEVKEVLLLGHDSTEIINSKRELERVKKHYKSLFDNTTMGIGIYDTIHKKWLDFNNQFLNLFGVTSKEEAIKYKLGELSPEFQPNGKDSAALLKKLLPLFEQKNKFDTQWTHCKIDGTEFHSETSFIPLDDDQPGLFCVAIHDLSEQIAHQTLLEQKNHELEQYIHSNMQLENLAYSACHDLKEPLRTIGTFTQIIKNKYENVIDDKSKEYMNFIVNGVTRMNHFVDGLFAYARVRETKTELEDFSLSQLLEFIVLDLNQNIKEKNAVIEFHNIPGAITANRTKIKQLFQNMIANAIKFQQPSITPHIKIVCTGSDTYWNFSISDNGIGIAEEFHDHIFTLFRKLHSKDQYEGSGIGLALCKEIVEQHKGTISVDSKPREGTTFHFSISRNLVEEG